MNKIQNSKRATIINDKSLWEKFILAQPWQPFFQSWNWGQVQERVGNSVFRFGMYDKNKLTGICLAVLVNAKRGRYLHLRHGPLLSGFQKQFTPFLAEIKAQAKDLNADFIRMSPLVEQTNFDINFLKQQGFRNAPIHNMDAENAWVLDLDKSEEEILAGMRKTTRYLVKKAQTLPIIVTKSTDKGDFAKFMRLYETTSKRHHFIPHRGVEEEFDIFCKDKQALLFLAHYKKKILSGAFVIFYGDQAVYHHGASSDEFRDIPTAYLLQWEAIKEAKRQGKKLYNFWGVVPPEKPRHPWQGLTLFKTGFGGRRLNFIHAQDLPLSISYWKTFAIETVWRIRRGY